MSSKKNAPKTPAPAPSNVISLDALLGNWPTIELAGIQFTGRHFSQTEKAAWLAAEAGDDPTAQRQLVLDALNARGAGVTLDWVNAQPDVYLVAIVHGLYGNGWPGDNPK